jgi:hypothetical protein
MKNKIKQMYARHLRKQVIDSLNFELLLLAEYPEELYKSSSVSLDQHRKNTIGTVWDILNLDFADKIDDEILELESQFEVSQEIIKETLLSTQK